MRSCPKAGLSRQHAKQLLAQQSMALQTAPPIKASCELDDHASVIKAHMMLCRESLQVHVSPVQAPRPCALLAEGHMQPPTCLPLCCASCLQRTRSLSLSVAPLPPCCPHPRAASCWRPTLVCQTASPALLVLPATSLEWTGTCCGSDATRLCLSTT